MKLLQKINNLFIRKNPNPTFERYKYIPFDRANQIATALGWHICTGNEDNGFKLSLCDKGRFYKKQLMDDFSLKYTPTLYKVEPIKEYNPVAIAFLLAQHSNSCIHLNID